MASLTPKSFAVWAHANQPYGASPYITHLLEVVAIAESLADEVVDIDLLRAVGYLHDVIEDTPVTRLFLDELFGGIKAKAVALLTDPDLPTRRERKEELHRRMKFLDERDVASRAALLVKLSDRVANVRACCRDRKDDLLQMYASEHAAFRDAVWRSGLGSELWEELDRRLTR